MNKEQYPHTLIRASAGAGKTYKLTERYINLLSLGAEPQRILATTFTRKAAGEILDRLLTRLSAEADHSNASRDMLVRVCRNLHLVTICTLDSFFSQIAHVFHHELDLPPQANMVGDGDAAAVRLRRRAIDAMLSDTDLPLLLDLVQRLYHDSTRRGVTEFIDQQVSSLYDVYRGADDAALWQTIDPPLTLDGDMLETAMTMARHLVSNDYGKQLSKGIISFVDMAHRRDWQGLLSKGIGKAIDDGSLTYYKKDLPPEVIKALSPLVTHARADMVAEVLHRTRALHDLLERFDKHYTQLRHQHRTLLFSDLPHRLRSAEVDLIDLYFRLDGRIEHLMLDEFQDTSLQQWDILAPIAQEITAVVDGHWTRSFFCVGDVKQAIYGWRGGCAEVFDRLQDDLALPPEAIESLERSWRSSQVVLDAVNQVFGSLDRSPCLDEYAPVVDAWSSRFNAHSAVNEDLLGYVQLMTTVQDDEKNEGNHLAFVAGEIAAMAQRWPDKSIGVLTSRNDTAAQLLELLVREHSLDASGEGGRVIDGDPAVAAILSALTVADHPGHTAAAFHVINSPMGAIVELDRADSGVMSSAALRMRQALLADGYAQVIAQWARQLAPSCDARSVARLALLVEIAERYEGDATLRPSDFVTYVQSTQVAEPTPAQIRVMTVHRSKGLEFDAVVLPELKRTFARASGESVYVYRPTPTDEPQAVFGGTNATVRAACEPIEQAYQQEVARRLQDDLCGLYVAMTRAKQALYMYAEPRKLTKSGGMSSLGCAAATILRDTLATVDDDTSDEQMLFAEGDPAWAGVPDAAAIIPARIEPEAAPTFEAQRSTSRKRIFPTIAPSKLKAAKHVNVEELVKRRDATGRLRGTVMHKWFEQVGFLPDDVVPDDDAFLAMARGGETALPEAMLREMLEQFRTRLSEADVVAALSKPAGDVELWRERIFAVAANGQLMRGAFDRVTIVRDRGRAVSAALLDYKSDHIGEEGESPHVEAYRPQINAYRDALSRMLEIPKNAIMTRLLFVTNGHVVDV